MEAFVSGTFMTDHVKRLDNTTDVSYKSDNARNIPLDTPISSIFAIHVDTDFKGPEEGGYTEYPMVRHGKLLFCYSGDRQ